MESGRLNEDLQRLQLSEVTRTNRELGRGSYATVFEVVVHGTPCAAKEMHPILLSDKRKHDFLTECVRSSQLLHPNLVQFIGIHYSSTADPLPWLVMELMYISLTGLIENYEKKHIPVSFKLSILVDVSQGLQFLHNKSIAHRDLSSNNVLLTRHLVAKIADLGMAKVMEADLQKHTLAPGTQVFMPPEALSDELFYGFPIDVFSLGCVTIHLVSMQWPTPRAIKQQDKVTGRMIMLTEQQRREKYFVALKELPALEGLVERCLQDNPNDRPAINKVTKELRTIQSNPLLDKNVDIVELYNSVVTYKELLHCKEQELVERSKQSQMKETELLLELEQIKSALAKVDGQLVAKGTQLAEAKDELDAKKSQLDKANNWLVTKDTQLAEVKSQLVAKEFELAKTKQNLQTLKAEMKRRETREPPSTGSQQMSAAKAIKIVNPNTMKEVDTTKSIVNKFSPVSLAWSMPKPESEQVQQQFKQNIYGIATTTSDDATTTQPTPLVATITSLVPGDDLITTVVAQNSITKLTSVVSEKNSATMSHLADETMIDNESTESEEEYERKQYSRDFLLSLQFLDQCKRCPPNFDKNAEYARKMSMLKKKRSPGHWTSQWAMELYVPLEAEEQMRKETQEIFIKFVNILNQLTPQKFETLANQALQLPVDTEERLKGCIDRIFNKALEEQSNSLAYALLCRVLSKISVEVGSGPEAKKKTFRSLLLTKCQQEFEKDKESDDALNELRKKVKEAAEKKQLEEELDEMEYQVHHKYLGNIRFIGELFKVKMLSEGIMHECIRRLLQHTGDEEALECFAKLMFTIGKDLDHEKGHGLIQQYMNRIDLIIKAGKISPRIKLLLQDVVELRNCHWIPRRESNNPDQMHKDSKQEAEEQCQLVEYASGPRMGGRQMSKGSIDFGRKGSKDFERKIGGGWQVGDDKDKKSTITQQPPKLESTKFRNIGKGGLFSLAPSNKLSMRPGGSGRGNVEKISRQESTKKPSRSRVNAGFAATSEQMGGPQRSHSGPDKHCLRQSALELASSLSRPGSNGSSKGAKSKTVSVLKRPVPDAFSEEVEHGLQFLPDVTTSLVADVKQLTELLKSKKTTNLEIIQYIKKEHPESKECSLVFIRDLLGTSMFHAVIDGSGSSARYNEELFDSRMELVTKYVQPQNDSQHQRQVEFLCAMQMVLHNLEQPAGLATAICKMLSETGTFEDDAFFRWRDSAAGIVGHGSTTMALKEFYEWLDSTPVESDYSQ